VKSLLKKSHPTVPLSKGSYLRLERKGIMEEEKKHGDYTEKGKEGR
jgi:hypothetical protein